MNKEERVKLVFETISKIVGFEIKPFKEFYMVGNGGKDVYFIDESLNLYYKEPDGFYGSYSRSTYNILPIFKGGYQLEEIKEPLLTEEAKEFLRGFKFEDLSIEDESQSTFLYMYNRNNIIVNAIKLYNTNISFNKLEKGKKYSGKELGL